MSGTKEASSIRFARPRTPEAEAIYSTLNEATKRPKSKERSPLHFPAIGRQFARCSLRYSSLRQKSSSNDVNKNDVMHNDKTPWLGQGVKPAPSSAACSPAATPETQRRNRFATYFQTLSIRGKKKQSDETQSAPHPSVSFNLDNSTNSSMPGSPRLFPADISYPPSLNHASFGKTFLNNSRSRSSLAAVKFSPTPPRRPVYAQIPEFARSPLHNEHSRVIHPAPKSPLAYSAKLHRKPFLDRSNDASCSPNSFRRPLPEVPKLSNLNNSAPQKTDNYYYNLESVGSAEEKNSDVFRKELADAIRARNRKVNAGSKLIDNNVTIENKNADEKIYADLSPKSNLTNLNSENRTSIPNLSKTPTNHQNSAENIHHDKANNHLQNITHSKNNPKLTSYNSSSNSEIENNKIINLQTKPKLPKFKSKGKNVTRTILDPFEIKISSFKHQGVPDLSLSRVSYSANITPELARRNYESRQLEVKVARFVANRVSKQPEPASFTQNSSSTEDDLKSSQSSKTSLDANYLNEDNLICEIIPDNSQQSNVVSLSATDANKPKLGSLPHQTLSNAAPNVMTHRPVVVPSAAYRDHQDVSSSGSSQYCITTCSPSSSVSLPENGSLPHQSLSNAGCSDIMTHPQTCCCTQRKLP